MAARGSAPAGGQARPDGTPQPPGQEVPHGNPPACSGLWNGHGQDRRATSGRKDACHVVTGRRRARPWASSWSRCNVSRCSSPATATPRRSSLLTPWRIRCLPGRQVRFVSWPPRWVESWRTRLPAGGGDHAQPRRGSSRHRMERPSTAAAGSAPRRITRRNGPEDDLRAQQPRDRPARATHRHRRQPHSASSR